MIHDKGRGEHADDEHDDFYITPEEVDDEPGFEAQHHESSEYVDDSDHEQPSLQLHRYYKY